MKRLFYIFAGISKKYFGIQLAYIKRKDGLLGLTAALSSKGFWYVGNVFDSTDIAYNVAVNGEIEKEDGLLLEKILTFMLKKGEKIFFYDIGANTGYYGIYAAYFGKSRIDCVSVEPLREHIECIRKSAELNRIEDRMNIFETALGSQELTAEITIDGSGSSMTKGFLPRKKYATRNIPVTTLDLLIKKQNPQKPSFIKIDVESYEYEVLRGATDTLQNVRPVFFIEVIRSLGAFKNDKYEKTFSLMRQFGYDTFVFDGEKLVPRLKTGAVEGPKMFLFLHEKAHADLINYLS